MSILNCASCAHPVDTDRDVEGYDEETDATYCVYCREETWALRERKEAAAVKRFLIAAPFILVAAILLCWWWAYL